jgi:hypothetical protein
MANDASKRARSRFHPSPNGLKMYSRSEIPAWPQTSARRGIADVDRRERPSPDRVDSTAATRPEPGSQLIGLPAEAFDERIAIVDTAGSGKTYAAKGFVERLLESGARVAIVDPLGVWWGLRASADGSAPGYPVVVFGGRHADVPITADTAAAPIGTSWFMAVPASP